MDTDSEYVEMDRVEYDKYLDWLYEKNQDENKYSVVEYTTDKTWRSHLIDNEKDKKRTLCGMSTDEYYFRYMWQRVRGLCCKKCWNKNNSHLLDSHLLVL